MDTRTIAISIVLALIIGGGAGYYVSSGSASLKLENQLEEYRSSIKTIENENSELKTTLTSALSTNTELQTTLTSATNENTNLQNILAEAKTLFESVESQLNVFHTGFGTPDYDSEWTPIEPNDLKNFSHGLGTKDDLFVYVIGRCSEIGFNQYHYGFSYKDGNEYGCKWWVDDTNVYVERGENDENWNDVRIYIWRIPQGPTEPTIPTSVDSIPDTKFIPIFLRAENTLDLERGTKQIIVDLEGYKEVSISWSNQMISGALALGWALKDDLSNYHSFNFLYVDSGDDSAHGSQLYRVQSKYLEILIGNSNMYNPYEYRNDEVWIIIYATK
jgi:hypothetical protein